MDFTTVQRRHWTWTLWLANDASIEDAEATAKSIFNCPDIRYSSCQAERPGGLGTKIHLQGYTEFKRSLRMSEVKKRLGHKNMHLEPRLGSRADARNYTISKTWKGESKHRCAGPWTAGKWISDIAGSAPQRKSHSDTAIECLLQGMTPMSIAAAHPKVFFTHSRKIMDTWQALKEAQRVGVFDYKSPSTEEE